MIEVYQILGLSLIHKLITGLTQNFGRVVFTFL